jgi:hypothetical protein
MSPDVPKTLEALKSGLSAIGIQIQDKFIPVAISGVLIYFAGQYGLDKLETLTERVEANEKAIEAANAAREKMVTDYDLASISSISGITNLNRETIQSISEQINAKFDGFWIPIPINFESKTNSVSFRLPIQDQDKVRMSVYSDQSVQNLLERYMRFRVNKAEIDKIAHYFVTEPVEIDGTLFRGDRYYQEFDIGLRDDVSDEDFQKINREQVSILIVLKRPIVVQRQLENVPE